MAAWNGECLTSPGEGALGGSRITILSDQGTISPHSPGRAPSAGVDRTLCLGGFSMTEVRRGGYRSAEAASRWWELRQVGRSTPRQRLGDRGDPFTAAALTVPLFLLFSSPLDHTHNVSADQTRTDTPRDFFVLQRGHDTRFALA